MYVCLYLYVCKRERPRDQVTMCTSVTERKHERICVCAGTREAEGLTSFSRHNKACFFRKLTDFDGTSTFREIPKIYN